MPAFLRQSTANGNVASPGALAFTVNPLAHSIGFCSLIWLSTAGTPTVTDNVSGTWTLVGAVDTNGTTRFGVWRCLDMPGGATTVTGTLAGATFGIQIAEFANVLGTLGIDYQTISTTQAGGSTGTLAVAGDLLLTTHVGQQSNPTNGVGGSPGAWTTDRNDNIGPGPMGLGHLSPAPQNAYVGNCVVNGGSSTITRLIATRLAALATTRTTQARLDPRRLDIYT